MLVVGSQRTVVVRAVPLLMVRVGLLHTGYVGRLAGLAVVGAASMGELDEQAGTVVDGYVVLDDVHAIPDVPPDAVLPTDSHGVPDVYFLRQTAGSFAAREEQT